MKYDLGSARPSISQEMLLSAALLGGKTANDAWQKWKASNELQRIDPASYRILPLIYRNLLNQGFQDSLQPKLKGIYRHTWYRNQLLFRDLDTVITELKKAGIQALLLKGAALISGFYGDYGIRPMHDLDIAVPWKQAKRAIQVLSLTGWQTRAALHFKGDIPVSTMDISCHALSITRQDHASIDLHFHMMKFLFNQDFNQSLWNAATSLSSSEASTLNPTDQLLLTCVHGPGFIVGHQYPNIQWVTDIITILRNKDTEIDWDRLVNYALTYRVFPLVSSSLDYITNRFEVSVPTETLRLLEAETVGRKELTYSRLVRRSPGKRPLGSLLFWYLRYTCDLKLWHRLILLVSIILSKLRPKDENLGSSGS